MGTRGEEEKGKEEEGEEEKEMNKSCQVSSSHISVIKPSSFGKVSPHTRCIL